VNTLDKIKQLEDQLAALRKEVENKPIKQEEWPKLGDKYYYLDAEGDTEYDHFHNWEFDKYLQQIGNMFKTEEEAKAYKQYLMKPSTSARAKLQMWADKNNENFEDSYCYLFIETDL